jgi:ABC-type Fe3+ transport system permease subunit/DNA-binding beta-propeller fold protein YncE
MAAQLTLHPAILTNLKPSSFRLSLLCRTLLYNGSAAVLATLMSLPAAIVIGRGRGVIASVLAFLLPVAVFMPSITYTYGWLQVFRLAGVGFDPASAADVARCVWTLACWLWALPAVGIGLSLRMLDSQVQQQAMLDGALWRVTLRQLAGPIAAAAAMVMVLAIQEFGVYERSGISVVATEVRTVFETGAFGSAGNPIAAVVAGTGTLGPDQPARAAEAVATALPLLAIVAALTFVSLWGAGRLSAAEGVGVRDWPKTLDAGPATKLLTGLLICLTLILPVAAMIASISPSRWQPDRQGHIWPVRIWLWAGGWASGSLLLGALSGAVALAVAGMACARRNRAMLVLSLATFLIGGELLAIANIRLYNRNAPWPISLLRVSGHELFGLIYDRAPVMVIAYLGRFGWLALLAGEWAWSRPVRELRDLAAVDGAGPGRTVVSVVWPIVWPVLLASALLVMILSMTEVGATVLLSPQRPQPLVPVLMGWVHMLRNDEMLEGTLLLMALVLLLGLGFVVFAWLGIRLAVILRRLPATTLIVAMLLMVGCDDSTQPNAIWLETGIGLGQTVYPRGITYSRKDDCFFVVDRAGRIQRIESDGRVSAAWRMPKWENGKPVGLSVGPDGNVYMADTHYARVMVFSPTGKYLREWGTFGRELGQFIYPTDVAFDALGNIYVSEYGDNDRIQVFDPASLKVLRTIGHFGQGDGELARPQSMVIDGEMIYVTDAANHRIAVFKIDGTFVRNMCSVGSGLGQLKFPYGLDEDGAGHLVVTEFGNNRVQIIDKETGRGLRTWGMAGREPGQLAYPWAATVDRKNRIVVVDSGNNRLQVFR